MHTLLGELSATISLDFRALIRILIIVLNFIWTEKPLTMVARHLQMVTPTIAARPVTSTTDRQGARTRDGTQVQALQTRCCHPLTLRQRMEHGQIMIDLSTK